jgi:serine/threonine protein kinase
MAGSAEKADDDKPVRSRGRGSEAGPDPVLGDYRLLGEMARGPDSIVYKAHQKSLDRPVALEVFFTERTASEEEVQHFLKRATTAAALDHPNLVPIYEVGVSHGRPFVAMGFVEGRSLGKRVGADGRLTYRKAAELVKQVAETLQYVHSQGVTHRNLGPETVLLNVRDRPRVVLNGAAKRLGADQTATVRGAFAEPSGFEPPEFAGQARAEVSPSADIFGLGAVLFYAMTGRPPTPDELSRPVPRSVLEASGETGPPQDLVRICRMCLRRDPRARYATAAEVADDLGRWLRSEPIVGNPRFRGRVISGVDNTIRRVRAFVTGRLLSPWFLKTAFQGTIAVVTTTLAIYLVSSAFRKTPRSALLAKSIASPPQSAKANSKSAELGQAQSDTFANVTKGKQATALVEVDNGAGKARTYGTAFCLNRTGLFVTNAHVIESALGPTPARVILVLWPGQKEQVSVPAQIVRSNAETDLALLAVDHTPVPQPLELGRADRLVETMDVMTFGFPFGPALQQNNAPSVTVNVAKISALRSEGSRLKTIQLDGALFPGHSGGPILDRDGRVIAVIMAKIREGVGLNLAIPVNELANFLAAPEVSFDPPAIIRNQGLKPLDWVIGIKPGPMEAGSPREFDVSVRVATKGASERVFPARPAGLQSFTASVTLPSDFLWPGVKSLAARVEVRSGSDLLTQVERQVPVGGEAPVDVAARGAAENRDVCVLPGTVDDVAVAGGGRFLLLLIKSAHQLAVYEMAGNRIVKSIPLLHDDVLIAGGEAKFVLLYRNLKVLHRFDLAKLEKDLDQTLPVDRISVAIALGSRSSGPIFWAWLLDPTHTPKKAAKAAPAGPVVGRADQLVQLGFISLDDLKGVKLQTVERNDSNRGNRIVTDHNLFFFPSNFQTMFVKTTGFAVLAEASARGELFAVSTSQAACLVSLRRKPAGLSARSVAVPNIIANEVPVLPGPEGRTVVSQRQTVLDLNGRTITSSQRATANQFSFPTPDPSYMFPTPDPSYMLRLSLSQTFGAQRGRDAALSVALPSGKELLRVEGLEEFNPGDNALVRVGHQSRLTLDKRFHLDTASRRLVTLSSQNSQNDRLVSRPLDFDGAFDRLGDLPVVTSPAYLFATSGQEFRHQIEVRSKKGGLTFTLPAGTSPALSVTDKGVVIWKVPAKSEGTEVAATVTIRDAAGQETSSVLWILVR